MDLIVVKTDGQRAYEGYLAACDGKSLVSGAPLPAWEDQAGLIRAAWEKAAEAAQPPMILVTGAALRCKVRVSEVLHSKNDKGETDQERVKLCAVYSNDPKNENARWSKWTPSANFELYISNPAAFGKLSNGHEFYIDFTPAK